MVELKKRDLTIVKKIIEEISEVSAFIDEMDEHEFYTDAKTQKAVAMTLINIGELSTAFTADFIDRKKNIPWKDIRAMRNVAAHNYGAFNMEVAWKTVKEDFPKLQKELETP